MVQDFSTFLQNLVGGREPSVQAPAPSPVPTPAPVPTPQAAPQAAPVQQAGQANPAALLQMIQQMQAQQGQPQQMAPPPQQVPVPRAGGPQQAPMNPQEFARFQQAAPAEPEKEDDKYSGTWNMVEWTNVGGDGNVTTYRVLVPEAEMKQIPDGANVIATIENEPERVKSAEEVGAGEQPTGAKVGLLDQMPEDIQGAFRSQQDQFETEQGLGPQETEIPKGTNDEQLGIYNAPPKPTTQAAVDDTGRTPEQIQRDSASALIGGIGRAVKDMPAASGRFDEEGNPIPALTTKELYKTNPIGAGILEKYNIYNVPVDRIAIREESGRVRLVPLDDGVPEGAEVITYGGDTPEPVKAPSPLDDNKLFGFVPLPDNPIGTGIENAIEGPAMFGLGALTVPKAPEQVPVVGGMSVADVFETTQRKYQSGLVKYADFIKGLNLPGPVQDVVIEAGLNNQMANAPVGSGEFIRWQIDNPEIVEQVRENGYVDEESGRSFEGDDAIWEVFQSERNLAERTFDTVGTDPWNILPTMGAPARAAGANLIRRGTREAAQEGAEQTIRRGADTAAVGISDDAATVLAREGTTPPISDDVSMVARRPTTTGATTTSPEQTVWEMSNALVRRDGIAPEIANEIARRAVTEAPEEAARVIREGVLPAISRGTGRAFDVAADIADIPENVLGEIVNGIIRGARPVASAVGNVPLPGGRNVSDIFATDNATKVRDETAEVETQVQDVVAGQEDIRAISEPETGTHNFPNGMTATKNDDGTYNLLLPNNAPIIENGTWDAVQIRAGVFDDTPTVRTGDAPTTTETPPTTRAEQQAALNLPDSAAGVAQRAPEQPTRPGDPLATDRPINDLGRAPDQRAAAEGEVPTDRDVSDMGELEPITREDDFWKTKQGQNAAKKMEDWPEYLKPQTIAERQAGEGRVSRDLLSRTLENARALAPERADAFEKFTREASPLVRTFARKEDARKFVMDEDGNIVTDAKGKPSTRKYLALQRESTGTIEDGMDLKRATEVVVESDLLLSPKKPGRALLQKYLDHFGEDAVMPEYVWKRWGDSTAQDFRQRPGEEGLYAARKRGPEESTHDALDTLAKSNGEYVPGTPLHEAIEMAIYLPARQERQARAALDDIRYRLGIHKDTGELVEKNGNFPIIDRDTVPNELVKTEGGGNILNAIPKYRERYLNLLEESRGRVKEPTLTQGDVTDLSRLTTRSAEDIPQAATTPEEAVPDPDILADATDEIGAGRVVDEGEEVFNRDYARSLDEEARQLDPEGARVADQTEAATAFTDAARPAKAPSALPYRTSDVSYTETPTRSGTVRRQDNLDAIPLGPPGAARRTMRERLSVPERAEVARTRQADPKAAQRATEAESEAAGVLQDIVRGREAKRQARKQTASPKRDATRATRATSLPPAQLDSLYVRGRTPGATMMRTLGQEFENGDSILARWDKYTSEYLNEMDDATLSIKDAENRAAVRVLNDWRMENLDEKALNMYQREMDKLKKAKPEGEEGKPLTETEMQIKALERVHQRGGRTKLGEMYDNFMSGLREVFLYNVLTGSRYIQTQALGNSITLILTKHYGVLGDVISYNAIKKAIAKEARDGNVPDSLMTKVISEYGGGGNRGLTRGGNAVRDQTTQTVDNEMRMSKIPGLGWLSPIFANRKIRDTSAMFDIMPREALFAHLVDQNMLVARNQLRQRMIATLPANANEREILELFDALPQRFSASDVRRQFGQYDQKWADRHGRDWQEAFSKTDKAARDEVKRVFFDGGERNIDRALKRVFFFHYWMSRATPLYTEAIARDPIFLYNYANLLQEMSEDDDLSGTDFVKWFKTPWGYNTLIRPDAFFQAFGSFMEDAGYTPDGESKLGAMLRKSPIMVNPVMDMLVNVAGLKGDTFAPDPLGTNKFMQLGQAAIDNANNEFGWNIGGGGPVGNPSDSALKWFRSQFTGTFDFLPGINEVPHSDAMAYKENEVRSIVAEIALERGLELDDPIVQTSMIDSESEMYQEAMKRYARQDAADILLRILPVSAVLYPKSQLESPKQRTADINAIKNANNGENTPESLQLMGERDTIGAATEYSRTLKTQNEGYHALGTPEERGALKLYYNINYGSTGDTVYIGGKAYTPQALQNMEDGDRELLADQWAEESGNEHRVEKLRAERAQFREDNPEYAEYSEWRNVANDYEEGPVSWWEDAVKGNPNAERWFNALPDDQKENELTLTSTEAFMAARGEQASYWDPDPIETRDMRNVPYDPATEGGSSGSSGSGRSGDREPAGPTKQRIAEQIQEYNSDMEAYNSAASQMLGGQPVNVDLINPMARQAVESNLRSMGIEKPRMGGYLYDYMQWAEANADGDSSVGAYLDWYKTHYPQVEKEVEELEEDEDLNVDAVAD